MEWAGDHERRRIGAPQPDGAVQDDEQAVRLQAGGVELQGNLGLPEDAHGLILFAHGSGSSRHSRRNRQVAAVLREAGLGTLLIDLLTVAEERGDAHSAALRFNIALLAERVRGATDWIIRQPGLSHLAIGYFGASTGAAAALVAAAERPDQVRAIVSRGGRPDLAGAALARVRAPTLLIVGGRDIPVIGLNETALTRLTALTDAGQKGLTIVPGATHLFEEPGALEAVSRLASDWFRRHFQPQVGARPDSLRSVRGGAHHESA